MPTQRLGSVERWDKHRGVWVLYEDKAQASADCTKHLFDDIPRRIFLDTNIINLIAEYPEQILDGNRIFEDVDETKRQDIDALTHIFALGRRACWNLVVSHKTWAEAEQTECPCKRRELVNLITEISAADLFSDDGSYARVVGRRMIDASFTQSLPDKSDRELIGNAIGYKCDAFCTRDRQTIIRKRDKLLSLPIRILTPPEWWSHIRPWSGLWM